MEIIILSCYNIQANETTTFKTQKNKVLMIKTQSKILICLIVATLLCGCLFACDKTDNSSFVVDYNQTYNFNIKTTQNADAWIYEPVLNPLYIDGKLASYTTVQYRYGLVFYVGEGIAPDRYTYLADALAKQGFLVVIAKNTDNMSYLNYSDTESAFGKFPDVKFFVGGHSQGGGAAIRRSYENAQTVVGTLLLSPIGQRQALYNNDGSPLIGENGAQVYLSDSLAATTLPILLLDGENDKVRASQTKADVISRLNDNLEHHTIKDGAHMGFCTDVTTVGGILDLVDDRDGMSEEQKQYQLSQTISYALSFMRQVIATQG